ncbi:MAG: DUF1559 domain-containing protein [Planctomycetota bacterium]
MSDRRGFTLTELLVVLSILAVLGAMAVPALRAALERADRTVCLSNLRQIGQAMHEYVLDHGQYPAAELSRSDAHGRVVERVRWYHALAPYLDAPRSAWSSGQGRVQVDGQGRATGWVLPSEDDADPSVFPDVFRCPKCRSWEVGRNMSYGYNHQRFGDARVISYRDDGRPIYRRYPVRPDEIGDARNTVLICDSNGTGLEEYRPTARMNSDAIGNHGFTVDPPRLPTIAGTRWGSDGVMAGVGEPVRASRPSSRHRGGACVLFADYHVEWIAHDRLMREQEWFLNEQAQ